MCIRDRVLYGTYEDDIISQYVTFTKVYNEQMEQYGRTRETIMETIRICKDKNAVSYTHLDVYKRQGVGYCEKIPHDR